MARAVVEGRLSKAAAARTYGVTAKIVARWVERFLSEGPAVMGGSLVATEEEPGTDPGNGCRRDRGVASPAADGHIHR